MMPGRRFTTGAAVALRGLRKSHSDPYRTEGGGSDRDAELEERK